MPTSTEVEMNPRTSNACYDVGGAFVTSTSIADGVNGHDEKPRSAPEKGSSAAEGLTSSGHKLHRLRTLGLSTSSKGSVRNRNSSISSINSADMDQIHVAAARTSARKPSNGLHKYFAKIVKRDTHSDEKDPGETGTRPRFIRSHSTGSIHQVSLPTLRRNSSLRSSSRKPSLSSAAATAAAAATTQENAAPASSALERAVSTSNHRIAMSKRASDSALLSSSVGSPGGVRPKSIMTVRTLDESLGRGGSGADTTSCRRKILRCISRDGSSVAYGSLNDLLRRDSERYIDRSSSVHSKADRSSSVHSKPDDLSQFSGSVSFHEVRIREYPMTVGDNPAVSSGVAVTLDWDPIEEGSYCVPVDEFEDSHPDRRDSSQMRMPGYTRRELLSRSGHSVEDIKRGLKDVNIAKRRRSRTLETFQLAPLQELKEKTSRAIGNTLGSRKKDERDLLSRSLEAERVAQRQRAEAWAEEERRAAVELADLERILLNESESPSAAESSPEAHSAASVCINEDDDDTTSAAIPPSANGNNMVHEAQKWVTAAGRTGIAAAISDAVPTPNGTREDQSENGVLPETLSSDKDAAPSFDSLQFLSIRDARRQVKESSNSLRDEMAAASCDLENQQDFLRHDISIGGIRLSELSKLQVARLNNDIAKLLNNVGCFLYLDHRKDSAVKGLCQSLNVLIHMSDPKVATCDETQTPEISEVASSLRRVLLHLFNRTKVGIAAEFTRNTAVVLSNLLKAIIKKKRIDGLKNVESAKESYKVHRVCDIKTACMLVKTNAELHVWLGRYWDAIANYEVLRTLLEQRLGLNKGICAEELDIEEETIAVLQKMRMIYEDVLLDSGAAGSCLSRIADHSKRSQKIKLELRQQQQILVSEDG